VNDHLDLRYPSLQQLVAPYLGSSRTESRAFLVWFLEHFYRLDPDAAQDVVCDGQDDKGIDGIFVDQNLESIDIFQSKVVQNPRRRLGDPELQKLAGTLTLLADPQNIEALAKETRNTELRNLLQTEEVAKKVAAGYSVHGIFIVNVERDPSADSFLHAQSNLELYDASALQALYVPAGPSSPIPDPATFHVDPKRRALYHTGSTRVVVAPLKATELVKLDGISNGSLFAWNVRQSLGRTKVNKQIAASVADNNEHPNFILFHNGLTVLCQKIEVHGKRLVISGYMVVNGCQSLTTLYDQRDHLSDNLELLARLIELDPDDPLAAKITHHSNNQNAISARDLQSNSVIQRRLQREFSARFGDSVFYAIKRGEAPTAEPVIDNEEAARILLAFDLEQPWACHQTYRLFDELHTPIFARPEVTADRIFAQWIVFQAVMEALSSINHPLIVGYRLTRYFLLYLLKRALTNDQMGERFCQDPLGFIVADDGFDRLHRATLRVLNDLVIDLNAEIDQRESSGNPLDYKRELKSPTAVKAIERNIISPYLMAVSRDRASSFSKEWEASAPPQ
jgi:hypothetical protein